jgi:hypothetical protein
MPRRSVATLTLACNYCNARVPGTAAGLGAHALVCRKRPPARAQCTYCWLTVPTGDMTNHWSHCDGHRVAAHSSNPCRSCADA